MNAYEAFAANLGSLSRNRYHPEKAEHFQNIWGRDLDHGTTNEEGLIGSEFWILHPKGLLLVYDSFLERQSSNASIQ